MTEAADEGHASAADGAAVVLDGVVKRYGSRTVLDGVSLTVGRGEVVAVLGPNGAGKTTAVEIVEGYRARDGGQVRVLGTDPARGGRALRARVGLMLQDGGVDRRARPRETLAQYAGFHADPRDPDELLRIVGLEAVAGTAYRQLSGGERQRLGLAMALVGRPEVVILDEPTAGMDPEARAATRRIIADLRDEGAAILLTSHDLADVERSADRIVVLVDGRVVASGSPSELMAAVTPSVRFSLDRPLDATEIAGLGRAVGGSVVALEAGRYRVDGITADPTTIAALTEWCATADRRIVELKTVGGSLEDAYLALVGGS
jgi:ABC-2 type transport system ATP-binding protein